MAIVMGVLIISFGVWGIADIFKGFGQSTVAKVGGTEISLNEFRQTYTDRLQQISRQFGRPLSPEQARAFGLDRQVLQQTIAEAALDEEARRLGLGQSDDQIRQVIMNDPNFKGVGGSFDPNRFQAVIRNVGYTEQRYVSEQRKVSLRRQITGTIGAGLEPPKTMLDVLTRFQNEQRAIEFVRLDAAQAGTIDAPSPEALAAYFEDHKVQFRAPEYRKIAFVVVSPEEIGKWSEVSDEDAKKVFDQRKDRLGTPEKRQIQQIVFPNAAEAQAARERLTSGTSFEDLGKERGLSASDVNLGLVTKSSLDPAVGDAVFALPAGEIEPADPGPSRHVDRQGRQDRAGQ
ncbi:parvulin-like peptidyl-prolyl isomerase [Bradyrhizobium sp. LM4.3]